jgi:hypothetical protein
MAVMKRLKSWFFTVTTNKSRFRSLDTPTEETYRNLFESLPAFLETEDRAKENMQGLVHKATDSEAKSYDETETSTKTKAVVPSQLPELIEGENTIEQIENNIPAFTGSTVEVTIASNVTESPHFNKRNVFILSLKQTFISWLRDALTYFNNTIISLNDTIVNLNTTINNNITNITNLNGGDTGQYLEKQSNTDGDYAWVSKKLYQTIKVSGANQIDYILLPFNATVSIASSSNVNVNSPSFPTNLTADTPLLIDTTGTDVNNEGVITFLIQPTI